MAEPTSALGFYDLLLRIAEKVSVAYYGSEGQDKAIVPVDAFNLDKCKRIINDGFRRFDSSSPPRGWHWKERIATITLSAAESGTATSGAATYLADTGRTEANDYFNDWVITITSGTGVGETAVVTDYISASGQFDFTALSGDSTPDTTSVYRVEKVNLLPEDFSGEADGPIEYAASTNIRTQIQWVNESTIRHQRATFIVTGYVQRAAIRPYEPAAGSLGANRRWELLVDPAPVAAHILQFPYTSYFNEMDCETGTATGGSATTLVDTGRAEAATYFAGWILTIIAGTGLGQTATITTYDSGGTFNFTALSGGGTPDTTSVYYVEPAANLHPAGIKFDQAILQACLAEVETQIEEMNGGALELFYKIDLPLAHKADGLTRARKLQGKYQRGYYGRYPWLQGRTWLDVTYD